MAERRGDELVDARRTGVGFRAGGAGRLAGALVATAEAFDFTVHMRRICDDIVLRMEEFEHVRIDRVAVAVAQSRSRRLQGLQAKLTPMRFAGGSLVESRRGRRYTVERIFDGRREILYILTFYLPRFLDQPFEEKLTTVFHELYHISPEFDGDLRRMGDRHYLHTRSQKQYDAHMGELARKYLRLVPENGTTEFLQHTFGELQQRHGEVVGCRIRRPRLIPL